MGRERMEGGWVVVNGGSGSPPLEILFRHKKHVDEAHTLTQKKQLQGSVALSIHTLYLHISQVCEQHSISEQHWHIVKAAV